MPYCRRRQRPKTPDVRYVCFTLALALQAQPPAGQMPTLPLTQLEERVPAADLERLEAEPRSAQIVRLNADADAGAPRSAHRGPERRLGIAAEHRPPSSPSS